MSYRGKFRVTNNGRGTTWPVGEVITKASDWVFVEDLTADFADEDNARWALRRVEDFTAEFTDDTGMTRLSAHQSEVEPWPLTNQFVD